MLLFRPFIELRIMNSHISPRDICSQAILTIQRLLRSYSRLYSLRRTPSFVPYFVLIAGITQLALNGSSNQSGSYAKAADPQVSAVISQCIADLGEMASLYHFAKIASNILQYIADVRDGKASPEKLEDIFRHYPGRTHLFTMTMPAGNVIKGSRLPQDKTREFKSMRSGKATILDIANTPFWLFATQSRPMMHQTQDLEQSRFSVL
jgi:hypothetical protein